MERQDTNMLVAGVLSDLAAIQTSTQRKWGYKQAAAAIRGLDDPIESMVESDGTLRKIPRIGPASTRIILEGPRHRHLVGGGAGGRRERA